jgi:hypothetical protein
MPPVEKNMIAAGKLIININVLCRGVFSRAAIIVMMEIIMNPMRVPNITAHFDFCAIIWLESPINSIVARELSTNSNTFMRNFGDLKSCIT